MGSDQRLQILSGSAYVYPDVTVVCGPPSFNETRKPETLLNPTLLVEVLSESTADKDRSEKFMLYRQIPGLQQQLMRVIGMSVGRDGSGTISTAPARRLVPPRQEPAVHEPMLTPDPPVPAQVAGVN